MIFRINRKNYYRSCLNSSGSAGARIFGEVAELERLTGIRVSDSFLGVARVSNAREVQCALKSKGVDINRHLLRIRDNDGGCEKKYIIGKSVWAQHNEERRIERERITADHWIEVGCEGGGTYSSFRGLGLPERSAMKAGAALCTIFNGTPAEGELNNDMMRNIAQMLHDIDRINIVSDNFSREFRWQNLPGLSYSQINKDVALAILTLNFSLHSGIGYDWGDFTHHVREPVNTFTITEIRLGSDEAHTIRAFTRAIANSRPLIEIDADFSDFLDESLNRDSSLWIGVNGPLRKLEADEVVGIIKEGLADNLGVPKSQIIVAPAKIPLNVYRAMVIYPLPERAFEMTGVARVYRRSLEFYRTSPAMQDRANSVREFIRRALEAIGEEA